MIFNDNCRKRRTEIEKMVEKAVTEEVINFLYINPTSLIVKTMGL